MFNRSAFGRVAYNRPFSTLISGYGSADMVIEALSRANIEAAPIAAAEVLVEATADGMREIVGAYASADVVVEALASGLRELLGAGGADVIVEARSRARYTHRDKLEFTGPFDPGDIIVIDSSRLKITKNGQNALHLVNGDPFDLNIGENEIIYTDSSGERAVLTRITFRDKFV